MTEGVVHEAPARADGGGGLATLLAVRKVRGILFIDDGFDPLADHEPTGPQQDEIWASVLADQDARTLAIGLGADDASFFDGACVAQILAGEDDALGNCVALSPYVVEHQAKAAALRTAIDYLGELGVEVRTAGKNDWREKLDGIQIVFLDWKLGPDSDQGAVRNASVAAREIHQRHRDMPYIVLISSDPGVKQSSEAFSKACGLVGGMFDAMPKAWLADVVGVDLNLTVVLELYRAGDAIQSFMESLRAQAAMAIEAFIGRIGQLTVSDYANLQNLALRKDGHPLGDYLAELFSGLWADALFQGELRAQLDALDKQDFGSLPALIGPSSALAELYNSAVFDMHVGRFAPHPQAATSDASRLHLSLGDIVVERKEGKPIGVFAVLNPQCDLAESPLGNRRIPDDQSVLMVPGSIEPIDHVQRTERKDLGDTPFFMIDGAPRRIHWSGKNVRSVEYGSFSAWLASRGERTARMRPLHALALQRAVSSELTRVGLPNPPPIHDSVKVTILRACLTKWAETVDTPVLQGRFVMARDSKSDRIVFTHSFVVEIASALKKGLEQLDAMQADWKAKDAPAIDAIRKSLRETDQWRKLSKPFVLPEDGIKMFGDALLVCRRRPSNSIPRKLLACVVVELPNGVAPNEA